MKLLFDPNFQHAGVFDGKQQSKTDRSKRRFSVLKMALICFVQFMARSRFLFLCHLKTTLLISPIWRTNTSNCEAQRAKLKLL